MLGNFAAILLATVFVHNKAIQEAFFPIAVMINTIPVVAKAPILVLDEATSQVDAESEELIQKAVEGLIHERTTFVIAHRISTVKLADIVLVMESGRITQRGTHKELMNQDGHYRDIAAVQLYGDDMKRAPDAPSHMDRMRDAKQLVMPGLKPAPVPGVTTVGGTPVTKV